MPETRAEIGSLRTEVGSLRAEVGSLHAKVDAEIGSLREDVRGVIREVRDTLYDLRTDVSQANAVAAQHPDGYLQTAFTLRTDEDLERWPDRGRRSHGLNRMQSKVRPSI